MRAYQKCFHDTHGSHSVCTISHPIRNAQFTDPESKKTVFASFANIAKLFGDEEDSAIKLTNLTYATIYPTNFEKQKGNTHYLCL